MADGNSVHPAQAAVFCAELHGHIDVLDGRASASARRLRAQMGQHGPARKPDVIASLQAELKELAIERRRVMVMLAAIGHGYPCPHGCVRPGAG